MTFGSSLLVPAVPGGTPTATRAESESIAQAASCPAGGVTGGTGTCSLVEVEVEVNELVLEVPDEELDEVNEKVRELMQGVAKLDVPLIVDVGVGANWDQAH